MMADEKKLKNIRNCIEDVQTSSYATLRRTLDGNMETFCDELLSKKLIGPAVFNSKDFSKVMNEFWSGLDWKKSVSDMEEHCINFLECLSATGPNGGQAADAILKKLQETVKKRFGLSFLTEYAKENSASEEKKEEGKSNDAATLPHPDETAVESEDTDGPPTASTKEVPYAYDQLKLKVKEPQTQAISGTELYRKVIQFSKAVEFILHTCNETEMDAVLNSMGPPTNDGEPFTDDGKTINLEKPYSIVLGMFGGYKCALVRTEMGCDCCDEIKAALEKLSNVKVILAIGFAYAFDHEDCKLADVLVSNEIVGVDSENSKVCSDGSIEFRCRPRYYTIPKLHSNVFTRGKKSWPDFQVSMEGRLSKVHSGIIIGCPILVNNKKARDSIQKFASRAIGGEMESGFLCGIKDDCQPPRKLDIIVIKGVSDYGDGKKNDEWQPAAALAAVDYAKYKLEKTEGTYFQDGSLDNPEK